MQVVEQALGVPMKRFERPMLGFLSREELLAVIGQPGVGWVSQRDCLLLALMYNTGARVSEVIGLKVSDVVLDAAACVHLHGKGRKGRSVPLWRSTVKAIRAWLRLNADLGPTSALLPNRDGEAMTRSNVTQRLALAVKAMLPLCSERNWPTAFVRLAVKPTLPQTDSCQAFERIALRKPQSPSSPAPGSARAHRACLRRC